MTTSSADAKLASLSKANRVLEDQLSRDTNKVPDPAEIIMGGTERTYAVRQISMSSQTLIVVVLPSPVQRPRLLLTHRRQTMPGLHSNYGGR